MLLAVSSSRLAGTERHVVDLAAGLRAAGVEAEVACEAGGEGLDTALEAQGVPVHRLAFTGPRAASGTARLAALSRRFDLVHSHLTHATAAAVSARMLVGRPVVDTRHFVTLAHQQRRGLRRAVGHARRSVLDRGLALTLAPSRAVAATVGGPVEVVPHGIDLGQPPRRSPGGTEVRRIVTVGRLERDRSTALVLRAFALARDALGDDPLLTVVGDGAERNRLERLAAELGIGERVVFTGRVPDVAPYLDDADVFLAPAMEAFGLAALEAMARGLPVLGVAAGGVAEVVVHEETGLLAAPEPETFAAALSRLAADPALAARFGRAGRLWAEQRFTRQRMAEGTAAAYRSVVGGEVIGPKVLRVYHSGVVAAWRERDRELRSQGSEVILVTARTWNEGGAVVSLDAAAENFVVPARTLGNHPARFVYDPRPLWRVLRRHRFDAVDVHEEPYSLAAAEVRAMARLLQPDTRLLLYSAQNLSKRYPWPFRQVERANLRAADAVYVCNEAAGGVVRGKGFAGEVRLLPLGVDLEGFCPAPARDDGPGFRVGYVGRLTAQKGVDVLLRAAAAAAGPGWQVVVAGDGPERDRLRSLAAAEGVPAAFLGSVDHAELGDLYRSLDVVVVPSLAMPGLVEQFGRVAVEAMASGVAVVASATGALPEVVGSGAVLVPPGDVEALAAVLRSLAADPEARRRLGRLGRARAARFSWPAVAAAHLELYKEVTACASTS